MPTPLPPVGANTPEDRMKLSYRFLEHAQAELDKGNRLQASEKVWGATAQALKSNAIRRGWNHDEHVDILAIANQLALEYDRSDLTRKVDTAEAHHGNFYANVKYPNAIQQGIDSTEALVMALDDILQAPYRPFRVEEPSASARLLRLTGHKYPIGKYSEVGFAQHPRQRRKSRSNWVYQRRDAKGNSEGNGDDNANPPAPTIRPRGGGPTPAGGHSNPTPKPRQPSVKEVNVKPGKALPKNESAVANGNGKMRWPRQKNIIRVVKRPGSTSTCPAERHPHLNEVGAQFSLIYNSLNYRIMSI